MRCLGTVGRLKVGGRNRVGGLGGVCVRAIEPEVSDRNHNGFELPLDADTERAPSGDDSSPSVSPAGRSSAPSAIVSPTRAPADRSISPNPAAGLGRRV